MVADAALIQSLGGHCRLADRLPDSRGGSDTAVEDFLPVVPVIAAVDTASSQVDDEVAAVDLLRPV